ncbi:MAG TPA: hypothetical protein VMN58_13595 [Acidimicrobiales bacterium]|nr:hypothetical protein [Acidimicrobiales bacterium]
MNPPRRKGNRRQRGPKPQPVEMWRAVPEPPPPEPVRPASDPTALVRSLGTPPLTGQGAVAEHYLAAVVERAAGLATALAAAADLLAPDDDLDEAEDRTGT